MNAPITDAPRRPRDRAIPETGSRSPIGRDAGDEPGSSAAEPIRLEPLGGGGWTKLRVSASRGITVVGFTDIALIHDAEIRQVDAELQRLIERGHDRIALNLEGVVRLSSQVIAAVLKAHRRCSAAGGAVKICQIHPDLKPIFALTGVFLTIDIHPDLRSALESAWPEPTPRHPSPGTPPGRGDADGIGHPSRMPVAGDDSGPGGSATDPEPAELGIALDEIFAAPSCASGPGEHERIQPEDFDPGAGLPTPAAPPLEGLAPAIPLDLDDLFSPPEPPEPAPEPSPPATPERPEADGADVPAALPGAGTEPRLGTIGHTSESVPPRSRPDVPAPRVRLIVLVGRAKGQAVAIATPRFLIGRDPSCHLRAVSPIVSRFHAVLERRDGRVFLRDLGSSNGTTLGDRRLRAHEEVEVDDGQRLEVGPMRFAVAIETGTSVRPDRPAESAPGHAAAPGALSQDPALRPLLHCPRCGTDGWIAADQLIPQLLQAIARALSPGSPLHVPVPHWHATPAPGASIGARSSSPVPEMHVAGRDGHAAAGARPSSPIARLGPSAGEVAPTTEGVADGRGYEWAGGPAGVAVPHAAHAPGNGSLAPAATPRRPGALPAVGVSASRREHDSPAAPDRPTIEMAVATPEDEVPEFHDGLDLAPPEGPADPAEERPARPGPASSTRRGLDIDFRCPQCGTQGWIPVDRLDRQFQCQACNAKLYTDPSGGLLVGDLAERPRTPNAFEAQEPDLLGRAIAGWKALPRGARIGLSGAAALLLCALLGWVLTAPKVPATLKDRAIFVAEAFAREDYRRLRAVAAPGSSGAVARWMDQVRPRFWRGKIQRVSVKVEIPQQDKKAGKAVVLAHVVAVTGLTQGAVSARTSSPMLAIPAGRPASPAPSGPPTGPDNRRIDLKLHWVTTRDGQWWLDWSRTAGIAPAARPAAGPDRAARSQSD